MRIGNKEIGKGNPVFIIAELSANHNQDYKLAVDTIHAMKEAGADAVKLQTYAPDTITIDSRDDLFLKKDGLWKGKTLYELYQTAYTPWEWQPKLKELSEKLGMICFSSPFDKTAVDFLEEMGVPAYKIASFEIVDIPLIEYVASKKKPVIISTGVAGLEDIELAIETCKNAGNEDIALLKCTSSYPAPYEEMNLRTIPYLAEKFGLPVGLSDHSLGISVPVASVALGAVIIEKHFILDKKINSPDAAFSLDPQEFKEMVTAVRQVEKALGKEEYVFTGQMKKSRQNARSLFVVKDIKKGEKFTGENIRSIRPGAGLHPKYYNEILGKIAAEDIKKGTPLKWEMVSRY